jgi:hypothetical protein
VWFCTRPSAKLRQSLTNCSTVGHPLRHKSAEVLAGYIREADKWTKSGLECAFTERIGQEPVHIAGGQISD